MTSGKLRSLRKPLCGLTTHIAILDAGGHILSINRAWRQYAAENGAGPEETFVGDNYLRICDVPDDNYCNEVSATEATVIETNTVAEGIRSVIQGEREYFALEYSSCSPTEPRWFHVRVTRIARAGPARVVVSHEIITERKLTELALAHSLEEMARTARALEGSNQELERTNQELIQFAYTTSHDLKAPLRGIANLSRWIEDDLGDTLNGETRHQLDLLRGRVNRMEAMIEGILQYSRVGSERPHPERVDTGRLLEESIDLLAPPPNISVEVTTPMPTFVCERLRLQQTLMNLISNAIKHNDRLKGLIRISCLSKGAFYEFTVSDDGRRSRRRQAGI